MKPEEYEPTDEEVLNALPIFLRKKPTKRELREMIQTVRSFLIKRKIEENG